VSPARILAAQAATLTAAAAGAWGVGGAMGVPGGWLSGAMIGIVLWSAAPAAAPLADPLRRLAMVSSGVAVGSAMTPALAKGALAYPLSLALMIAAICLATYVSARWLSRAGFERNTAFFASVPGALSYVFAVAAETPADLPRIAVVQLFRLFCLMVIVPIAVAEIGGPAPAAVPSGAVDSLTVVALLFAAAALVGLLGERAGLPAGLLFGAMLASGAAHLSGLAPGRLPDWLINASQCLVGAWVGSRFIGFDWRRAARLLVPALGAFTAALAVSAGFAGLTTLWLGIPFAETLIAFSPGALEAMTILAFALGADPLYVSAHHLARFAFISLTLPFAVRLWRARGVAPPSP